MIQKHSTYINGLLKKYQQLCRDVSGAIKKGQFSDFSQFRQQQLMRRLARYESRLKRWGIAVVGLSGLLIGTPELQAQTPVGPEFQINEYTTSRQSRPSIAMDSDGDFVVVWESNGQDGYGYGIYGQRYNSMGSTQGSEFQINQYTTNTQRATSIAMDSDGDFVVVWSSSEQDGSHSGVYGQRYNSMGIPQDNEFQINEYTTDTQNNPSIAMDSDGDFVVVWTSEGQDGDNYGIYGQRYNSMGIPQDDEFQINTYTTSRQDAPSIAMDSDGDFVVVWNSFGQDGDNGGLYGQRYNSMGTKEGTEFQINEYTTSFQNNHSIAMDSDGDFVVVWQSFGQDGSNHGIYGQRYNSMGTKQSSEFQINEYTTSVQNNHSIAMDSDGDFVVVWTSEGQDGDYYGIYGQRYNSMGTPQSGEFQINTYTTNYQSLPSIAMDSDGDFVVAWESRGQDGDYYGIYGQRYNSMGTPQSSEFQINTYTTSYQKRPSIAIDSDGDFVVVWTSEGQDGDNYGIYGQHYTPTPPLPTISVAIDGNNSPTESSANILTFRFSRDMTDIGNPITVDFSIGGTAIQGTDYSIPTGQTNINLTTMKVTFPANVDEVDLQVNLVGDAVVEEDETIVVTIF